MHTTCLTLPCGHLRFNFGRALADVPGSFGACRPSSSKQLGEGLILRNPPSFSVFRIPALPRRRSSACDTSDFSAVRQTADGRSVTPSAAARAPSRHRPIRTPVRILRPPSRCWSHANANRAESPASSGPATPSSFSISLIPGQPARRVHGLRLRAARCIRVSAAGDRRWSSPSRRFPRASAGSRRTGRSRCRAGRHRCRVMQSWVRS